MGAILMDLRSGEPYLDEYNNTVEVDNDRGFEQIIDGLFNCDIGSEPMNSYYGFDLKSAIRESSVRDSELFIESLVAQALNPEVEKLISKVEYIEAIREGVNMYVNINVTSIMNDQYNTEIELGD